MSSALPEGWTSENLKNTVYSKKGKKPKTLSTEIQSGLVPYIDIKAFEKGDISKFGVSEEGIEAKTNDSLMVWDGARSGLVGRGIEGIIGSTLVKIVPYLGSRDYLHYFLQSLYPYLNSNTKGTGIPHVDPAILWDIQFPLAPLNEQIRIANKLDSLLAKVNNAQTRLEKIPTLLKRFRQSVLSTATSGELTREWRRKSISISGNYPSTWKNKRLQNIGVLARGKSKHRPRNDPRLFGERYPFIQTGEIARSDGYINKSTKFYSDFGLQQSRLFPAGTLCITIAANIADTAILNIDACFPDSVVGFTPNENECSQVFIKYLIDVNKAKLETFAPSTAQKNINLKVLNELYLPIPPLEEQKEIVRRVESLFALADKVEKQYTQAKKAVDALTQSLLAKAFRGELVPQDPNDEPAEVLLKRIQDERQQQVNKPKRKIRNSAKKPQKASTMKLNQAPENYLHDLLTQLDGEAHAEALWQKSALAIDDFYAKLKQEMHCGHIIDDNKSPDPALRKLKLTQ